MHRLLCLAAVVLVTRVAAGDVTVTLDMNGYLNGLGARVVGTGLKEPIEIPAKQAKVELQGLQPGGVYYVDFFHNHLEGSSDFSFTIAKDGSGVDGVSLGGGRHKMVTGFKPGDTTLKLNTREITYNANGRQRGQYYLHGATTAYELKADQGPQKIAIIPGSVHVDNLSSTAAGREDFDFMVDSDGQVSGDAKAGEYAEFDGSSVSPRAAHVVLTIRSAVPLTAEPSHAPLKKTQDGNATRLDLDLPIGGGGVSVWSFGPSRVVRATLTRPDGKSAEGEQEVNDFRFYPVLRYDALRKAFYFETTRGPANEVGAVVQGITDDGKTELNVEFTAVIVEEEATKSPEVGK